MALCLKKRLPENNFYTEFNNTIRSFKTLLCFGLSQSSKKIWSLWGYMYNSPNKSHAESILLQTVESFFSENPAEAIKQYTLAIYISFSPCSKCCDSLIDFMRLHNRIHLDVRISKLYFPKNSLNQEGLKRLKHSGVSLRMMDRDDFSECFYLFVNEQKLFIPWSDLENETKKYSAALCYILNQDEDTKNLEKVCPESTHCEILLHKRQNAVLDQLLWEDQCTPSKIEREEPSRSEMQKKRKLNYECVEKTNDVKRRLFFED
ncbi:DNA dC-_dU-editing enzyme APOBEC-3C-like [Polypterus senegalus]|uniref:DNA dC->dU-editing enzyme APOBEC-3C-like n=1 Tax=Polypterus senegalus TaxID=55291 RepID=UPI001963017C|nr:DNA dC->dU-editing enzyme APOBEC-3C-like [Polypterus senegalus]